MQIKQVLACVAVTSSLAACGYRKKVRSVRAADVANPEATRIYNFMSSDNGVDETQADSLIDEAVIEELGAAHACFGLTIRSDYLPDAHPSQWRVKLNGVDADVVQRAEADKQFYTYTAREQETRYERVTPRSTTRVTEPVEVERTDGTVTRHARACAPLRSRPATLELEVVLPQPRPLADWGQTFEWRIL